jgi:hypothetical protein
MEFRENVGPQPSSWPLSSFHRRVACVELSQAQRTTKFVKTAHDNMADVVTPRGTQLVTHQARCVTGVESLLLQGVHYKAQQPKLGMFSDELLKSLAGNAFNCHCMAATLIVQEALLARLWHQSKVCKAMRSEQSFDFLVEWAE